MSCLLASTWITLSILNARWRNRFEELRVHLEHKEVCFNQWTWTVKEPHYLSGLVWKCPSMCACSQILPELARLLRQWRSSRKQKAFFWVFGNIFCCMVRKTPSTPFLFLSHVSPFALLEVVGIVENIPTASWLHSIYFILFIAFWVLLAAEAQNLYRKQRCLKSFRQKIAHWQGL